MNNRTNFYVDLLDELEFEEISFIDDNTEFKELNEWDSMSVLVVINFFKQKADITLTPDRINNSITFGELFNENI